MFSVEVTLIGQTWEVDDLGQEYPVESRVTVLAREKDATRSEFYQAAVAGLKPELVFDVHSFEYSGERKLVFDGREYSVIRTYRHIEDGLHLTELVCEPRTGHG